MKKTYTLILLTCLTILSCSTDNEIITVQKDSRTTLEGTRQFNRDANNCYTEIDLIAGQHYTAGIVSYQILNNDLVVTYTTTSGWEINATHLYVGECDAIPTNRRGNPKVGHFPYQSTEPAGTTEVVWVIPLSEIPECDGCIAAHAEVSLDTGNGTQQETAWANGEQFPGNNWAMFLSYCLTDCAPPSY